MVEALIAELDKREADPDLEDSDPCCTHVNERGNSILIGGHDFPTEDDEHDGTEADNSYAEWDSLHSNIRRNGGIDGKTADSWASYVPEDAEDDDPREDSDPDRCLAGEDWIGSGGVVISALGFGDGTSLYEVDATEDMEPLAPLTLNDDADNDR